MFSFEHIIVLLRDYWDVFLLEGLRYTLILSAIAVLFGAVFGSLIAFGRLSNSRILRFICSAYTEVVRDTPLLVQIYLFVLIVPKAIGTIVSLSTFQAVAMAFAFNSAAYVSEIVRSGIQAVDAGQTEAARSLASRGYAPGGEEHSARTRQRVCFRNQGNLYGLYLLCGRPYDLVPKGKGHHLLGA